MTQPRAAADAATLTWELPAEVRLDTLNDDRFRVKEPIPVRIFKDDEGFILAEAVGFKEFGEGDSPAEALDDLRCVLVDLYFSLEGGTASPGPVAAIGLARLAKPGGTAGTGFIGRKGGGPSFNKFRMSGGGGRYSSRPRPPIKAARMPAANPQAWPSHDTIPPVGRMP